MELSNLISHLLNSAGVQSKNHIVPALSAFNGGANLQVPNGDDTAVIPAKHGYDLFAIEGFLPEFVNRDPWFAGWCGLMVNLSDIAAMGGRPKAVVNAIWDSGNDKFDAIFDGLKAASEAYNVPVVGGHTNRNSAANNFAVAILGHTENYISSFDANENDLLIAAIDLNGAYREPYLNWNAATTSEPELLRQKLNILPHLAENNLLSGCKDISQAGIIGTIAMFMECSKKGAHINLKNIPAPPEVNCQDWLLSFPSFGFVLTCNAKSKDAVLAAFRQQDISANVIGKVNTSSRITLSQLNDEATFWDFSQKPFFNNRNPVSAHSE